MRRYIDADKFAKDLAEQCCHKAVVMSVLDRQPTADVEEVRHGEWIEKDDGWDGVFYTCSVCHCDWTTIDGTPFENNMRYCPECGAKMDGERKNENANE